MSLASGWCADAHREAGSPSCTSGNRAFLPQRGGPQQHAAGRTMHRVRSLGDEVRLRAPDGQNYKRTFSTKRDAEAFEAEERSDRRRGTCLDPRGAEISFAE